MLKQENNEKCRERKICKKLYQKKIEEKMSNSP
jgi:hypothetical protein